ncbi:MAG: DNA polymerase IV [Ignavibacteria bacterium]|nr:DNA polymerase IV [Ignavibacteria bacterium]
MQCQKRYIAHLDLDCFYVSVERIKDPSLNGKPVIVGGSPSGRGVVASASYEARAFGVRSAMPTAHALRLCPSAVVVRSHFAKYTTYSNKLYRRILELAPVVERASIDEMYLDLTGCEVLYDNDLPGFIRKLQKIVWREFYLPCTISLASNKSVAKIAAGTVKPAGVIYVPHGTEMEFLAPLPIDVIPGVGKKTGDLLRRKGFTLVGDLQAVSRKDVTKILGKYGLWIHEVANGIGPEYLTTEHPRKSIGNEETFSNDIADQAELEKILFSLVEEVCSSLRYRHLKARTFTLKLRYSNFDTVTRAETIAPTYDDAVVFQTMKELMSAAYTRRLPVRLLGVRASHLIDQTQLELELFPESERRSQMLEAIDKIRKKFGDDVIHMGNA